MRPRQPGAQHARPREGADRPAARVPRQRDAARRRVRAGRHRRRREAQGDARRATGWRRATSRSRCRRSTLPAPVMAFAIEPKTKGDEDKVFTALRRLQEEDPTIDLHRDDADRRADRRRPLADPRRGRDRAAARALRRRGRAASRRACPTRRRSARARRRTGATRSRAAAAASSATATSRSSRSPPARASSSSTRSRAASIPASFIPAVEKGVREAMQQRRRRRLSRSRTCACGSTTARTTRSTPPRWRSRSPASLAMREALAAGRARCCSSRSCTSTVVGPRGLRSAT